LSDLTNVGWSALLGINSALGNITLPVFADNLRISFQFRYPLSNFAANLLAAFG
jgi:hypothetical protein